MDKILVVYDNVGFVLYQEVGKAVRIPQGVQYIVADLPAGKQLKVVGGIGVDVTGATHKLVFENIPKDATEMTLEQLNQQVQLLLRSMVELSFKVSQLDSVQVNGNDIINQLANLLAVIKEAK